MKAVLIDASSAILLYKAGLFDDMTTAYALGMVPAVFEEVTQNRRPGCDTFGQIRQTGKLAIVPLGHPYAPEASLLALGAGERDTIIACRQRKAAFIVLDDRKGARFCRSFNIPYTNALVCAKLLFWSGIITGDRYASGFDHLLTIGRYAPPVLDFASQCTIGMLSSFLP